MFYLNVIKQPILNNIDKINNVSSFVYILWQSIHILYRNLFFFCILKWQVLSLNTWKLKNKPKKSPHRFYIQVWVWYEVVDKQIKK